MLSSSIDVNDFLSDFYSTDVLAFGASIALNEDEFSYVVLEVVVGNDISARGYVVLNAADSAFLFFLDVDRDNLISTAFDVENNATVVSNEIDVEPMYYETNEFDVIGFLDGDYEDPTLRQGRPFWGSSRVDPQVLLPCIGGQ